MTQHRSALLAHIGATRWPYRVLTIESPTVPVTTHSHATLLASGVDVRPYSDGAAALLGLLAEDPCAVVAPTDLVGIDLDRFVAAVVAWCDVPIIVGLVDGQQDRAFRALDAGARGVIGLPAHPTQLMSAMRHLGVMPAHTTAPLRYGRVELDRDAHRLLVDGTPVSLSAREFALVELLVMEAPRVVSTDEIGAVIGATISGTLTHPPRDAPIATSGRDLQEPGHTNASRAVPLRVRKYVQNLRRKLAVPDPTRRRHPASQVIETVRGIGYRISDAKSPPRTQKQS